MAKVGQITRGTVKRILPYGAIVELEEGTVGLVHISEIADRFVRDVSEYCREYETVTVQVLPPKEDGRWEFSMKRVGAPPVARPVESSEAPPEATAQPTENFGGTQPMYDAGMPHHPPPRPNLSPRARAAFDEKLRDFLSESSDKIEDARRHHQHRLGGKRR